MSTKKDVVFEILQAMLSNSPEASYTRLNPALRSTLSDCIAADLPFKPDTFARIFNKLRGHWWFGDGAGSHVGEHYYNTACEFNHASAIQSFEQFAGRPGVLWEENVKTPERLHVGSRFTWKGHFVTVTSMRQDSLVACTYQGHRSRSHGLAVGATIGYNPEHVIASTKRHGAATIIRVIKAPPNHGASVVARRFTIKYEDILRFRREESKRVAAVLALIPKIDPRVATERRRLEKSVSAGQFRHWQLEKINAAVEARTQELEEREANERREQECQAAEKRAAEWLANKPRLIEEWRQGRNGAYLAAGETLLRVKGDLVECSNGNQVSVAAVRHALPVVLDRRKAGIYGPVGMELDGHLIERTIVDGVKVGCTFVAWSEIDYVNRVLSQGLTTNQHE